MIQPALVDYEEHELRAAHAELYAARQISLPFAQAMEHGCWKHVIRCRAKDLRNRRAARTRSGYVPAVQTDIRHTIARAMQALQPLAQRELDLEEDRCC